jgi:hypothetical protein
MRQQHQIIEQTVSDFRQILCRINIFEHVASMFMDTKTSATLADVESSRLDSISQPLIPQEILDTTQIVYFGGVIDAKEILTMKKLLFRSTRGKAVLSTFDLAVSDDDRVRGEDF